MSSERWQQIDAVFAAALERPPAERSSYLDTACGDCSALRREVDSLLALEVEAEDFMEAPVPVPASLAGAAAAGEEPGAAAGDSVGAYRIVREIARGGMGAVYLAERADDAYRRQVAIKLLRPGMASAALVRRFHGERQILASLDHPNIARLFDGGTTADGRPYLVMEYIDGQPIDEYCDGHRLSVDRRIELFRQVCSAVHTAHQNLVVHRDIKPSNILVAAGPGTGDGVPRLLDFGIAKLLDPAAFPHAVETTLTGLRPMTPSYASPEQVRGAAITTASDVYSLGVLLYQLLTGRLPHRFAELSPREVERVLTEESPEKPSTAAGEAASRGTRPRELRRQLAGDLDNIVMKALRKEPARRYGSVEQLSEDLHRHRVGLPVLARQDALGYQVATFLRRHKLAVAVAGLILALVLAFAGAMARQAALTARQRDRAELARARAEQERQRAEQQQERAEQVSDFLVDLFKQVDPWTTSGDAVTAREVLDRGAEKIERELGDQPEVRASLLDAIGVVYRNLGLYDDAAPLLEQALETREATLTAEHPEDPLWAGPRIGRPDFRHELLDLAESLFHVAGLYQLKARYAEAEPLYRRALEIRENALGQDHFDLVEILNRFSDLQRRRGELPEAESLARRALEIARRTLGSDHPQVAGCLASLGGIRHRQGEAEEAEGLLEEALAINEKAYGDVHATTAAFLYNLGTLRYARGELDEAEAFLSRSLAAYEKVLGAGHPNYATNLFVLAAVAKSKGDLAVAEERYRRALELLGQALGEEHTLIATCLHQLGELLVAAGRSAEAEPLLRRSLALREKLLGPSHPLVAESLRGLADLRQRQDRLAEAERLYLRALGIWESQPGHEATEGIPQSYAELLRATGRVREAEELERRAAAATAAPDAGQPE